MAAMEKTTMYLPPEMHRRLEEAAKRSGQAQADIIREALQVWLDNQEQPTLRSLGAAKSNEITGRTARAWLRKNWHQE
jgi:predicted DNA-binding protein